MENAFLHSPLSLDVRVVTHHMLRDWHKNLSMEKIPFFHNIAMCPSESLTVNFPIRKSHETMQLLLNFYWVEFFHSFSGTSHIET